MPASSLLCLLVLLSPQGSFRSTFDNSSLPEWKVDADTRNTVRVVDGVLRIEAFTNTYAHVERRLGVDNVTASAVLKPDQGQSWCNSLFLYWSTGNWCQVGVRGEDGGRYYTTKMADGAPFEANLSTCRFDEWHHVRIQLGRDVIRLLSSEDGRRWRVEQAMRRPFSFRGAPALVIVGKGYGRGDQTYPNPDLDNNYADPGVRSVGFVREVSVEATPRDLLLANSVELGNWRLEEADGEGSALLAAPSDPTYEAVARLHPGMKRPKEAIGVPDGPTDFLVTFDGQIVADADAGGNGRFEAGSPLKPLPDGTPCHKSLLAGHLPVVTCQWDREGLKYRQVAFGWSEGMSPDAPLSAYLELTVRNPGVKDEAVDLAFRSKEPLAPWHLAIPAHSERSVFVRLPYGTAAVEIPATEFRRKLADVSAFWRNLLSEGMSIQSPEQRVNDAWKAWLATSFLNVDKRDGVYEPHDGVGFYEMVFGFSAAQYCNALDLWGRPAAARRYFGSLLTMMTSEGLFDVNFGLPDTGALLHGLASHYFLTRDATWFRSVAPKALKMCEWLATHRRETMLLVNGKRPVWYGLIKHRPYCDYPLPTFSYVSDAFGCEGMEECAMALAEVGLASDADRVAKQAAAYRKDILASMKAATFRLGGLDVLPMEPDTRRVLRESGYRASEYYGLIAGMLLETDFLPPAGPQARIVTDFIEQRGGLRLGMMSFGGGVDHAYTYGYWLNCLRTGEPKRAILGLYASLAYGMSRETFAGVEVTRMLTGDNEPTLPHLYSATEQLRLLRMMLVREDQGNTLWLGQAIPRHWMAPGKSVRVQRASTAYGKVSYTISSDGRRTTADVSLPTTGRLASVFLRLPNREGRRIRSATMQGKSLSLIGRDIVRIDRPRGRLKVTASYR